MSATTAYSKLTVLQVHNAQLKRGGADVVLDNERELLVSHGHVVPRFIVDNREALEIGKFRSGFKAIWNQQAVKQVQSAIEEHRPDVVHVHTPFPILSPAVFRCAKGRGVPTICTLHSYRFSCVNGLLQRGGKICQDCVGKRFSWPAVVHKCYQDSRMGSTVLASSLALHHAIGTFANHVDLYLALSEFAKQVLVEDGFPADKVVVKPNFILGPKQPGQGDGGYAMFVGRLVAEKGVRTVIRAWREVDPSLRLLVVGEGPLLRELKEAARDLSHVEFLPWKPNDQVLAMMQRAELVVFSSDIFEAGPLVVLESYACGTPVVASDVGNFTELVHAGRTGVHFKSGSAIDLAAQVNRLMQDRGLLRTMRGKAFQEYQERYSPEVNYGLLMKAYQRVIEESSRLAQSRST